VWNFTSGKWQVIGNQSSPFSSAITAGFNTSFSDIVNSGYMYLAASSDFGNKPCWENISTDYIKVDVQLSNTSVVPCGNVSVNQTCKFSWVINSTGVNDLRAVDVNCSSAKSTVANSNSNETYVYLKGIEVHTDESTYTNCGSVYYTVSTYDQNNNLINQNMTIGIYNSSGSLVSQSKVQSSGIYQGIYNLLPGAPIGQWVIQASSCGIFNKTFGVGVGNSSDLWNVEWLMPERVEYAPSETVSFTIEFYNQEGMGIDPIFTSFASMDGSTSIPCSKMASGVYSCSTSAPTSTGTHAINIYAIFPRIVPPRYVNETRYIYVGG
jgi:hypothetical protein